MTPPDALEAAASLPSFMLARRLLDELGERNGLIVGLLFGHATADEYDGWRNDIPMPPDAHARLACALACVRTLKRAEAEDIEAARWLVAVSDRFDGRSPAALLLGAGAIGVDLARDLVLAAGLRR